MKKRLLKKLLKQVVIIYEGLHIFMELADTVQIPNHQIKLTHFEESKEQISLPAIAQKASGDDSNLSVFRSDINKNGDPFLLISERIYPVDFKQHFFETRNRISQDDAKIVAKKYENGSSLRDLANLFRYSKSKIRSTLKRQGLKPRVGIAEATHKRSLKSGKQGTLPYYGFCYFEGQIVKDPREFPILQMIHRLWSQRKSIHQINLELNRAKVLSRKGKTWSWAAIQNIVVRFETKKVILSKEGKYEFR